MTTVLLTAAGGAAIPGLIKHLKSNDDFRVFAADMDRHAIGLYYADKGFVIPPANSSDFLPTIRYICKQENVNVFIPLVDEELVTSLELEQEGIPVLIPRKKFVESCLDKFALMNELRAAKISIPDTRLGCDDLKGVTFPALVKPRTGRGSRGVGIVHSQIELAKFVKASSFMPEQLIVQNYIDGTEFTVSVTVWRDGNVQAVVPKEIICKEGITRLAVTRHNPRIDSLCRDIQERLRADGPFNVQLRLNKKTGIPLPFEINPRFSTTVSLTIAAGIDELGELVKQATGQAGSQINNNWREGVVLLRRTLDEFVDETNFNNRAIKNLCNNSVIL